LKTAIIKQPRSNPNPPNGMSEYKIALFGSGGAYSESSLLGIFADGEKGVGKSSLTGQFVSHMWTERYDPTIEDAFRKEITVDGHECVLEMYFSPPSNGKINGIV
jgi:hypothetical protein